MLTRFLTAAFFAVSINALVLISSPTHAKGCIDISLPENPHYTFQDKGLSIRSYDGTSLDANIFVPKSASDKQYPAIIFINSWLLDDLQYLIPAERFARDGYVVLSYATRGFGCSEGIINVADDGDIDDVSAVVDYLQSRGDVDMENIGVAGISYGSGIGLIGLAKEPRIKTAVAMSTWGSLIDSLYGQETPRLFWGLFLTISGGLFGDLDPSVPRIFGDLLTNRNINFVKEWSAKRSPLSYVDLINERRAPVFIANNYGDGLFGPNSIIELYEKLEGPKRLELNQGTHFSGEGPGLFGFQNYTWDNMRDWFAYWLKNDTRINIADSEVSILTDLEQKREVYSQLPANAQRTFYLSPRGLFSSGGLETRPYSGRNRKNTILSGLDSGASTGIPALSALLDGNLKIPVKFNTFWLNRANGIIFKSEPLSEGLSIRGIPKIQLRIEPSRREALLMAYLYDLDERGIGTLITHAPISIHDAQARRQVDIDLALNASAYDIPAGHRVALAFDTFDLLYDVPTLIPYSVEFHFGRSLSASLDLPIILN